MKDGGDDRHGQQDDGDRLQQCAENEHQKIHHDDEHHGRHLVLHHQRRKLLGNLEQRHDAPEEQGRTDDDGDHAGCGDGLQADLRNVGDLDRPVDEHGEHKAVDKADGRRLRRGEGPGVYSADDDEGEQDPQDVFGRDLEALRPGRPRHGDIAALLALPHCVDDEKSRQGKPRDDSGDEELPDGVLSHRPVDDHGDAGRDEDAKRPSGGKQPEGELLVIPSADHGRVGDHSDRGRRCGSRPGDGGEEGAGEDGPYGEATGEVSHPCVHVVEQVVPHATVEQDLTHQHEDGDRERREALKGREHGRADDLDRKGVDEDQQDGRRAQGKGHGESEAENDKEQRDDDEKISHVRSLPFCFQVPLCDRGG